MSAPRRRARGALLGLALVAASGATGAPLPPAEALYERYIADPRAFAADVRGLGPSAPIDAEERRLLLAKAAAAEGRLDEALALALPIADGAADVPRRLRAGALVVSVHVASRGIGAAQRRLDGLLEAIDGATDTPAERDVDLAAAALYARVAQYAMARRHAERAAGPGASPTQRCAAERLVLQARLAGAEDRLDDAGFDAAANGCRAVGAEAAAGAIDVMRARWRTGRGDADAAADELATRLPSIIASGDLLVRAEAHAQRAESLRRAGRLDDARREAILAMASSRDLGSGLPMVMAQRTAYELALASGDTDAALEALDGVVAAERAYLEELRELQAGFQSARGDAQAREQALLQLDQRNAELAREVADDARQTERLLALLLPAGVGLAGLAGWTWHSRRRQRRHRQQLEIDALTGLWSRRHFMAQATAVLSMAERSRQPVALLLVDLDHFSALNAAHGHLGGDHMLVAVGEALRGLQGPGVLAARIGGEEFGLLLADAGVEQGLAMAERCRVAIAGAQALALDGQTPIRVTASLGVACTRTVGYGLRDLLARADEALYRAKSAGRNRASAAVAVAVPTPGAGP